MGRGTASDRLHGDGGRPVAPYMLLGAALAGGAGASYKLDNYLSGIGIPKGFTVSDEAIKAMDEFAKATPADVANPDKFIYRYSDLANKASGARLFNESPRTVAEWTVEEPKLNEALLKAYSKILNSAKRVEQVLRRVSPGAADKFRSYVLQKLSTYSNVLDSEFRPMGKWFNMPDVPRKTKFVRTHIPAMSESPTTALLRVMYEGATSHKFSGRERISNTMAVRRELGALGSMVLDESTGKLKVNPRRPTRLAKGVSGVEDMQRIIDASPVLSRIAKNRSAVYRGGPFKKLLTLVRTAQVIRNPKLRLALGALGAGSAGLGVWNLKKNNDDGLYPGIKRRLSDLVEKIRS